MAKDKPPEKMGPPAPRRMASPDIQALAKIDRMLAELDRETAYRTLTFLMDKYGSMYAAKCTPKTLVGYAGPVEEPST